MKSLLYTTVALTLLCTATVTAASIDMDDPRRALGREHDIRVDAQLTRDSISPGTPIGVVYQIQNFGSSSVAIADKLASASYDDETRTITLALGAEIPDDGNMPYLVTIAPGEKKVFRASAVPALNAAAMRRTMTAPRYVQVKVSILRDLEPFAALLDRQATAPQPLPDTLFNTWFESNATIFLNALPVYFNAISSGGGAGAETRGPRHGRRGRRSF